MEQDKLPYAHLAVIRCEVAFAVLAGPAFMYFPGPKREGWTLEGRGVACYFGDRSSMLHPPPGFELQRLSDV